MPLGPVHNIALEPDVVRIGDYPHERDLVGQGMALERDIRGGLLVAAIKVERVLDLIIATHLSGDNRQELINIYFQMLSRTEDGTLRSAVKWFQARCKGDHVISNSEHLMKAVKEWQGYLSNKVRFVVLLLKEGYPTLLQHLESPEHGKGSTSLERQLKALVRLRNDIAHTEPGSNVDPRAGQRPDRIVFVYYENGQRKSKPLTLVDAQSKEKEWDDLFRRLASVAKHIAKSRATSSNPRPET